MSQTSLNFLNLFVRPPGDLLFFLIAVAMLQAAFGMALGHRLRRPQSNLPRRYVWATFAALLAWALLLVGAVVALITEQSAILVLPPLERFVTVATILVISWAFISTDQFKPPRFLGLAALLIFLLIAIGYIFTAIKWGELATQIDFNLTIFSVTWAFVAAVISLLGTVVILAYFRKIIDAPLKIVFFIILLLGFITTLVQTAQGNLIGEFSGPSRLALAAALSLIPVVVYRMVVADLQSEALSITPAPSPLGQAKSEAPPSPPPKRELSPIERESVQLMRALGIILDAVTPSAIPEQVVHAALEVLKADIGLLLRLQDANYADIVFAYDRALKQPIAGLSLNLSTQPTLLNAIDRRAQRPLLVDRNIDELQDLYTRLDITETGPAYIQPLVYRNELIAVLIVAFPYKKQEMLRGEEELLKSIAVVSSGLLTLSYAAQEARRMAEERAIQAIIEGKPLDDVDEQDVINARQALEAELQYAREQISQLSKQVMELQLQLDDERSRVAQQLEDSQEGQSISQQILALKEEQQKLAQQRDMLARSVQQVEAAITGATATDDTQVVQSMVEALQREKADLEAQRDRLLRELDELRADDRAFIPQEMQALLDKMSAEKAQLEAESEQLRNRLLHLESQLEALGVEGGLSGLPELIARLFEQRTALQKQLDAANTDREVLLQERARLKEHLHQIREYDERIQTLQAQVKNLAADREAALKQRDQLRIERDEALQRVDVLKQQRAQLLARASGLELEIAELNEQITQYREQLRTLADERIDLQAKYDRLFAQHEALRNERDQLQRRLQENGQQPPVVDEERIKALQQMVDELTEQRNQLERELNQTRTAMALLEDDLEKARKEAQEAVHKVASYQVENPELLMGLVQELRTPMTSIIGYVDLLLGESAGILGEMQRKFLQRVAANVNRLASMLDDLVHLTELDTGQFVMEPEPVDVIQLIENALTNATTQFREKALTVHLNLQEDLPPIRADRDALTQVIGQLLTNAYLVSPHGTEIFITARRNNVQLSDEAEPVDALYVAVEDRGGGIAPEDELRVFARKYKAEHPLIQGLGDTGVGLSVARALIEAHGGKLWLEIKRDVGSIFCFALPYIEANSSTETLEQTTEG